VNGEVAPNQRMQPTGLSRVLLRWVSRLGRSGLRLV